MYTWIDAYYAVHVDMISHTEGDISMGHVVLLKNASVQRLNIKITTEAGLVGVRKYLPYNLWLMIFCMGRGMEYLTI